MSFYINEFKQHLQDLSKHAEKEYTEPVGHAKSSESLTETYKRTYRTNLSQGLYEQGGIGAQQPNLQTGYYEVPPPGGTPPPLGGGTPVPDGAAPKWQFGSDNAGNSLIGLLSQIWGEGWWAQWEQIWNNPDWAWYGWTESPYGGYTFNMPGSDIVFTVAWDNIQGWVFDMIIISPPIS